MRLKLFFLIVLVQLLPGHFQNVAAGTSIASTPELFKCPVSSESSPSKASTSGGSDLIENEELDSKYLTLKQIQLLESDLELDQKKINQLIDKLNKEAGGFPTNQKSTRQELLSELKHLLHNFILRSVCLHKSDSASANDFFESLLDYKKARYTSSLYSTIYTKELQPEDQLRIDTIFEAFQDLDTHGDN